MVAGKRLDRINIIINGFCEYYGVTRDELFRPVKGRSGNVVWKWKRYLIAALHSYTDLDLEEIREVLNYKSYQSLVHNFKNLQEELSEETYGNEKVKLNYSLLLKHLNL